MSLIDLHNPLELIGFAGMTSPGSLAFLPLFHPSAPDRTLILKARLSRDPIPPAYRAEFAPPNNGDSPPTHVETGRAIIKIPSDVARSLRGPVEERDVLYLVIVRRDTYNRAASGIVLPAQSPGIIVPG